MNSACVKIFLILANLFLALPLFAMSKHWERKYSREHYYACEPCRRLHVACDEQEICTNCWGNDTEDQCYKALRKPSSAPKKNSFAKKDSVGLYDYDIQPTPDLILVTLDGGDVSDSINKITTLHPEKFYKEVWADYFKRKMVMGSEERSHVKHVDNQCCNGIFGSSFGDVKMENVAFYGDEYSSECTTYSVPEHIAQAEGWVESLFKQEPPH